MGHTIGRRIPKRYRRRGEFVAMCDQCGANYYRSQLVEKPGGALLCQGPGTLNDAKGKDEYELSMGNAEGAQQSALNIAVGRRSGGYDFDEGI